MRSREHTHRCVECGTQFPCGARLERNYDGWPEVVCLAFHEMGVNLCEECDARATEAAKAEADAEASDEEPNSNAA